MRKNLPEAHGLELSARPGHLVHILAPDSFLAVWKGVENIRVKVVDSGDDYVIDEKLPGVLARGLKIDKGKNVAHAINYVEVRDEHMGLLQPNIAAAEGTGST